MEDNPELDSLEIDQLMAHKVSKTTKLNKKNLNDVKPESDANLTELLRKYHYK